MIAPGHIADLIKAAYQEPHDCATGLVLDIIEHLHDANCALESRVAALEAAQQPAQWQRCPICGGTGHMPENFYMGGTDSTGLGRVTCRSCNGLGRVK